MPINRETVPERFSSNRELDDHGDQNDVLECGKVLVTGTDLVKFVPIGIDTNRIEEDTAGRLLFHGNGVVDLRPIVNDL